MNIKKAKEQIKNAVTAYFTKDEFGRYCIPIERQRPVFLMGPPGIGKTAIMEQIAQELGVGLVSYSMTHHTRQSALGLPFITHKTYGGKEYDVSEYTMSEIIAAVYDMIEETGYKEGILFLDEINCISETLAPLMLQFLQYKVFGRHRVPDGWIVVTAGNPPEYNNSVREYDIATWDRLKRVDVEPDFDCWKEYAVKAGVHPSVTTYLEIKKQNFYKVESTVSGKRFVTARGWEDLSQMITLYERNGIPVDEEMVRQYLQDPAISKDFAVYYDLFQKYKSDYQVDAILAGESSGAIRERVKGARFDERLSLLGLLMDAITGELKKTVELEDLLTDYMNTLKEFRQEIARPGADPGAVMQSLTEKRKSEMDRAQKAGALSTDKLRRSLRLQELLNQQQEKLAGVSDPGMAFTGCKQRFDSLVRELKANAGEAGEKLSNVFRFAEDAFGDGQEMLILVTELTISYYAARFISKYGCKEYFEHNRELLFHERRQEIISELDELKLDDEL